MEIIHIVLGKANPNRMNGVNKVVYQLANHQAQSGRKVSLWGITKDLTHNYPERNFTTRLFEAQRNIFNIDRNLVKAIRSLQNEKVVFHLHGGWIPTFSTISTLLSKLNLSFVFTPHGAYNTIAMLKNKWIKRAYFQVFEKHLLQKANAIHCIGKSEVKGMTNIFQAQNVFLMPYGFESETSYTPTTNKPNEDFIIGFLGRLDIYTKGLDLLLDAFHTFQKKIPNTKLWIIGDSEERIQLEKKIKERGLKDQVTLWGKKFGADKSELLKQMDLFAHPSRNEGLPSSVLEAAALGVPCLVTEATNVGDFIGKYNCGSAVENENTAELSATIFKLYQKWESNQYAPLKYNAQQMVKEAFDWTAIVEEFDKLYTLQK